jgi:hypothetical protein
MDLLILQFSSASCRFFGYRFFPEDPILKYPYSKKKYKKKMAWAMIECTAICYFAMELLSFSQTSGLTIWKLECLFRALPSVIVYYLQSLAAVTFADNGKIEQSELGFRKRPPTLISF